MPLPPVESGSGAMTRRNYLVEMNRLRVSQYEETKKELDEQDVRLSESRKAEKKAKQDAWLNSRKPVTTMADGTQLGASGRPLPGGGPRSQRMKDTESQRLAQSYKAEKEEEAAKKREYNRLYEAEVKEQLTQRQATLSKMKQEEEAQMEGLRAVTEDVNRRVAEADAKAKQEEREYMERLRATNARELKAKAETQRMYEERNRVVERVVSQNNRHRAEMDELRQKNMTRKLQLQNEEYYAESQKYRQHENEKNADELKAMSERERRLAKEEREAEQAKKDRFRQEFDDCVARDKEFRRTHNYDEPQEVARQRNELAAQSYRLIQQEQKLNTAERKQNYQKDLMEQIYAKQTHRMTHLDEPGI